VYVWAELPWLYAAADLRNPSPYPAVYHVWPDERAQARVMEALERERPAAVLRDRDKPLFPALEELLAASYVRVDEVRPPGEGVGTIEVYRRRPEAVSR
ncbi:MAG TPA: hypothetical protein VIO14_13350, partial [Dehalococcoidia bacterium]